MFNRLSLPALFRFQEIQRKESSFVRDADTQRLASNAQVWTGAAYGPRYGGFMTEGDANMKHHRKMSRIATLLLIALLLTTPARAEELQTCSDTLWYNGSYSSTLGDMAGRRLYVCGIADNLGKKAEPETDDEIDLLALFPIGRLEVAELLYRICGEAGKEADCPFPDVPEEYREAVGWLYSAGITHGISSEEYGTGSITRAQFLTMLFRLLDWEDEPMTEGFMLSIAYENDLLPAGLNTAGFTHGDVYLILLTFTERYYPEKLAPVRPEMSRPDCISLTAFSDWDAERQVSAALRYAPREIELFFTADCPEEERQAFAEQYSGEYLFTPVLNTAKATRYSFTRWDDCRFVLRFYSYAPAYLAYLDTADWFRCFADAGYSRWLLEFTENVIPTLTAQESGDYEKVRAAQELVCELAAYDWAERDAIRSGGGSIHPSAHAITGFLSTGLIVCDGYANAYQWILRCLGVESFVVYGCGAGEHHAWNKVRIDGEWYNADLCWMDNGSTDACFLRSDAQFIDCGHSFRDGYVTAELGSAENYQDEGGKRT